MHDDQLFLYISMKARQRTQMLEKAVTEAQSSESRVSNLQQWIYHVDRLLNDFYENDTTIEDVPHDFQVSKAWSYLLFV